MEGIKDFPPHGASSFGTKINWTVEISQTIDQIGPKICLRFLSICIWYSEIFTELHQKYLRFSTKLMNLCKFGNLTRVQRIPTSIRNPSKFLGVLTNLGIPRGKKNPTHWSPRSWLKIVHLKSTDFKSHLRHATTAWLRRTLKWGHL